MTASRFGWVITLTVMLTGLASGVFAQQAAAPAAGSRDHHRPDR